MTTRKKPAPTPEPLPERFLTPTDLATMLGVPVQTLYQWRYLRTGPPGIKLGRHLRYDPVAVRRWVDEQAENDPRAA